MKLRKQKSYPKKGPLLNRALPPPTLLPPPKTPPVKSLDTCWELYTYVWIYVSVGFSPRKSPPSPPKVAPPRARSRFELPVLKKRGEEETRMEEVERRRSNMKQEGSILIFSPPNSGSY